MLWNTSKLNLKLRKPTMRTVSDRCRHCTWLIRTKTKHISYVRDELIFMWPVNGLVTNDFCVLSSHLIF